MTIQHFPDELDYCNAIMHPLSGRDDKNFLFTFCSACVRADAENYIVLRPALHYFMVKYPPDPDRWAMERRDRGL